MIAWVVIYRRHLCQPPKRSAARFPFRSSTSSISHLPYTLPSSVSCKSFACRSYENSRGVGVFFPFWYLPTRRPLSVLTLPFPTKCLPFNLFADPHPLSLYPAIFYKKGGGRVCQNSRPFSTPPRARAILKA